MTEQQIIERLAEDLTMAESTWDSERESRLDNAISNLVDIFEEEFGIVIEIMNNTDTPME